jgi:hypothetical protein
MCGASQLMRARCGTWRALDEVEFRQRRRRFSLSTGARLLSHEMEDRMKLSTMTLALCFALAPFAAHATAEHRSALHHMHEAQRHTIPATARAFVPPVKLDDDSDGLTRNHDECNRGCIDND